MDENEITFTKKYTCAYERVVKNNNVTMPRSSLHDIEALGQLYYWLTLKYPDYSTDMTTKL